MALENFSQESMKSMAVLQADIEESDAWLGGLCARLRGAQEAVQPEASPEKFRDKALRLEVEDKVGAQHTMAGHLCSEFLDERCLTLMLGSYL
jgi:hypothetical protein